METTTSKKVTRMILAGACAAALTLGTAAPALAAPDTGKTGETNVTFNPNTVAPGAGNWGIEIPRAIAFTNNIADPATAEIKLVNTDDLNAPVTGEGAIALDQFPGAGVIVGMWSTTGLVLTTDGAVAGHDNDPVPYRLSFNGAGAANKAYFGQGESGVGGGATQVSPSANTSTGGLNVATLKTDSADNASTTITATRHGVAKSNAQHSDTLTFGFKTDGTSPVQASS